MFANGPAIWGGCVTRRKHRVESWYFSQKVVTVQGGYGALFAIRVQSLLSITSVAVQVLSKLVNYLGTEFILGALDPPEAGVQVVLEPEIYHGAGFKLRADARVRV